MRDALERAQIPLCLAAIILGAVLGWVWPNIGSSLEPAITPVLAGLMCATFLGIPFASFTTAFRDRRFIAALIVINFVAVPALVFLLTRPILGSPALLLGVLLVLLAPCIDYVIAFTALARGDHHRLLALTPLLLIAQAILLGPLILLLGGKNLPALSPGIFITPLVFLLVIPLAVALILGATAPRFRVAAGIHNGLGTAMVPLMALTLLCVVGSQMPRLRESAGIPWAAVLIFIAFGVLMVPLGTLIARGFRLPVRSARALVMSGGTRNSLVVLPIALALPDPLRAAVLVVAAQTLVELCLMLGYVRVVPWIIPASDSRMSPAVREG